MNWLDSIQWDAHGLVPVIAQEAGSGDVWMFAFMNREALASGLNALAIGRLQRFVRSGFRRHPTEQLEPLLARWVVLGR